MAGQCETLTRGVLKRVVDRFDGDDRVILIRQLEIRWRLPERTLATKDALERLASDLIAALEPAWSMPIEPPGPAPVSDADVVVFADVATWWSDALLARSKGQVAWYHRPILEPEPLVILAEPDHKPLALAVLRRLGRNAPPVLRTSPDGVVLALAKALDVRVPEGPLLELLRPLQDRIGTMDRVSPELIALLPEVLAACGRDATPEAIGLAALAFHLARVPATAPLAAEALAVAETLGLALQRLSKRLESGAELERTTSPEPRLVRETPLEIPTGPAPSGLADQETETPLAKATSYAGLIYLVTLWLELGTGEHLWRACLPEGRLLGWAAAGLVEDDPILTWLGGSDISAPPITSAQADEVIAQGCAELVQALPRHRLDAAIPDLELFLAGNELIATLPGSVFPVWSAVCPTSSDLREATATLSELWPSSLLIPPSLEALRLGGRFEVYSEKGPRGLFKREGPESAARLATVVIGTAAALFERRTDEPPRASGAVFVERWLKIPGFLEDTGDTIVVHLRAEDVAFPVRRAGLDRDPGYVPWLQRTVRLCFEGDEPEDDLLPIVRHKDNG